MTRRYLHTVHGFEQLSYTTPESDILQGINFRPNVKGTGQSLNIGVLSGTIVLEEDTATMLDIRNFRPVAVPQGTNEALNIQVIPRYDTISLELDDRINLMFIPLNPIITPKLYFAETGEFLRDITVVRILDSDNLTINFLATDSFVGEEDGFVTIEMIIGEAQMPFTLTLTPTTIDDVLSDTRLRATDYLHEAYSTLSEVRKATPGLSNDYDNTVFLKTIPPSITSRVLSQNIRIYNDDINEIEQHFVLVGELGPEVPDEFACFRVTFGDAECHGRVGATGIRIRDNDPMILGFGERRQTVSEADATSGQEFINRQICITSLRTSEIAYPVGVRSVFGGQPTIEPMDDIQNPMYDGLFGSREEDTIYNLVIMDILEVNTVVLSPLHITIRDDFLPEEEECFELSIFQVEPETFTVNFMCNAAGDEFVCIHLICIEDNDEPFDVRIGFNQTMYTVMESAGSVEVCVNLTFIPHDILGGQVTVLVFHNDNSIYVPPNPTFATPDPPMGTSNSHNMIPHSDYEEETRSTSTIGNTFITEGRRKICYDQVIYDDERLELVEAAGLRLLLSSRRAVIPVEARYGDSVFFITDDDEAVVGLERIIFTVSEDVGVVELCARVFEPDIDCPIEFPFNIILSSTDRTAESSMDYGGFSTTLTFAACTTRRCVNVNIVNDVVHEPDEVFDYILGPPPAGLDPRITIRPDMGEVLIADDDELELYLINNSPRVTANSVEAEFEVNGPVTGVRCVLRSQVDRFWKDCSPAIGSMSAAVSFTNLKPGLYALKVQAYSRNAVVPTVKRGFVITSDPNYCSLVLVNRGVTVTGNSALITTELYGPATQLSCTLDGGDPFICRDPVFLSGLESGRHIIEISPLDCSGGSKTLSVKFSV